MRCPQGVEEPLHVVRHVMDRLGLTWNETKTHGVDAKETGFHFLGVTLQRSPGAKTGTWYPNVRPSDQAVGHITAKLTERTRRERTCIALDEVVGSVNRSLRGWASDFYFRNASLAMSQVRSHAEQRLRIPLRKRHKVKSWDAGYAKFPSRDLYDRHGLHALPQGPGGKTAHASVGRTSESRVRENRMHGLRREGWASSPCLGYRGTARRTRRKQISRD